MAVAAHREGQVGIHPNWKNLRLVLNCVRLSSGAPGSLGHGKLRLKERPRRRPGCALRFRVRNRFSFCQKHQVPAVAGLGGDFRPALTSRTSCSRHRLLSVGPAGRLGSPRGPDSRVRTGLRRGACVVRTREEGAAGQGCGCAEAGPDAAPAQWRGGAGRREAVAPAAAAEEEEEGGGSGGRCFCQFRLFVREVDPPLPEQPGGSCGSRGQCRPRPPAHPRAPPPPAMARDYDHLFKLLIIGDSGEGRRGRRRRGPCRARPAGASGRAGGRTGGRAGRRGSRRAGGAELGGRRPRGSSRVLRAAPRRVGVPSARDARPGRWLLPHV